MYSRPRLAEAKTPGSKWRSPSLMARSISNVPTTRSSVAETGRSTKEVRKTSEGSSSPDAARSRHSVHHVVGSSGLHLNRHLATTLTSGSSAASARAAVDLAVPRSPRIKTPPIRGLTAFSVSARRMRSCPTIAVNGNTGVKDWFLGRSSGQIWAERHYTARDLPIGCQPLSTHL